MAGALQLPQHLRVLCSLEGVGNGVMVAPTRTLVSSDVGVFGVTSAWLLFWFLEGVVVGVAGPRSCHACGCSYFRGFREVVILAAPTVGCTSFSGG